MELTDDLIFWGLLTSCLLAAWIIAAPEQQSTYELVHVVNGHEFILDYNLTEQDCINRLAPHNRNYCIQEISNGR